MTGTRVWTVALADDHPLVLRALQQLIEGEPEFTVVSASADGRNALEEIRLRRPDIAVIDVNMPKLNGLSLLREIAREQSRTRVIFLTAAISDESVSEAIDLGVDGIILKESAPETLVACMSRVVAGEKWLSTDVLAGATARDGDGGRQPIETLTARETEIAGLVTAGFSNKEIARRLALSEGTVKIHLHNIYRKLEITSRTALTALALARRYRRS
jgi:DNA-binding NarL/FixJ family response regulator